MQKAYIGDSVYAAWDGRGIWLTTENGEAEPTNKIYLEPAVLDTLFRFARQLNDSE